MKIIENVYAKSVKEWRQSHTCTHCRSRLEIEASDAKGIESDEDGEYIFVTCAACGEDFHIMTSKFPAAVTVWLRKNITK